jgi:hypothetical protein
MTTRRTPEKSRPLATLSATRGACRLLRAHDWSFATEMRLPNGRRADIVGMSAKGRLLIVEVKSCAADLTADLKWAEYREFCDQFYFAVPPDGPTNLIDEDVGLIVADSYEAEFIRHPAERVLAPPRRRSMIIAFARHSADRLQSTLDQDSS